MALPKPRGRGRPPEPKARYRRVADALRAQMRDGALKPGQNLPSLRRIARESGPQFPDQRLQRGRVKRLNDLAAIVDPFRHFKTQFWRN